MLLLTFLGMGMGVFVLLLVEDWPFASSVRTLVIVQLSGVLFDKLVLRPAITPMLQYLQIGPLLLLVKLWYLQISLAIGATRLFFLFLFSLTSFFVPYRCIFSDGMEDWDTAHHAFVSYVLMRSEMRLKKLSVMVGSGVSSFKNSSRGKGADGRKSSVF